MLRLGLSDFGFSVFPASSGREAVEVYQRHHGNIALVLSDVQMPGLDGPQTLSLLKKINPHVRCCFMSGDLDSYTEDGLLKLGAARVFQKPLQLATVAHTFRELLGSHHRSS